MFDIYGTPLAGPGWAEGHWVWLRLGRGPVLVQVVRAWRDRAQILAQGADPEITMIVPTERLAWTYVEAVAA